VDLAPAEYVRRLRVLGAWWNVGSSAITPVQLLAKEVL
jgi:hypothetical protein